MPAVAGIRLVVNVLTRMAAVYLFELVHVGVEMKHLGEPMIDPDERVIVICHAGSFTSWRTSAHTGHYECQALAAVLALPVPGLLGPELLLTVPAAKLLNRLLARRRRIRDRTYPDTPECVVGPISTPDGRIRKFAA
jgi:hypothetical protein